MNHLTWARLKNIKKHYFENSDPPLIFIYYGDGPHLFQFIYREVNSMDFELFRGDYISERAHNILPCNGGVLYHNKHISFDIEDEIYDPFNE